jgi:hypothetical protein
MTDDVTLSVTINEALRLRISQAINDWPEAEPEDWHYAAADAVMALLAAPLPPPRLTCHVTGCDNEAIGGEIGEGGDLLLCAEHLPPPPMKEPERGDVVAWDEDSRGTGIVFGFCTVAGTRYALIGDDGMTAHTIGVDWITENHGPPVGDEWNGWEVGHG